MEIYEAAKEILASSSNYSFIVVRSSISSRRGISSSTIYLYIILTMKYSEFTKAKGIETLSMISFGSLVIGSVMWYKNDLFPIWSLFVALGSLFCGLFVPIIAKQITWLWFKLAELMGLIMSKVVLGLIFYFLYKNRQML